MVKIPFVIRAPKEGERVRGLDVNLLIKGVSEAKGIGITGVVSVVSDLSGVDITGGVSLTDRHKGLRISGISNYTYNHSSGVEVAGVANYAGRTSKGIVQVSLLGNKVEEVEDGAFVLQVGLYNVAGDQTCLVFTMSQEIKLVQ
ncbi:hypothetical protein HYT23_01415 [Candidatus Pacearchaeota archaeon]|nr:hypothetical protein [Candidatus Pacearchaeota archaeon]